MRYKENTPFFLLIMAVFLIVIVYLMPICGSLLSDSFAFDIITNKIYGFIPAYLRSCFFAIISALLCTIGGLQIALCIRGISLYSRLGKTMSLLIIPIALGNMTTAYIVKCSLYGTIFFDYVMGWGYWSQTLLMCFLQFWSYGTLFIYLFWIGIQTIPRKYDDYRKAVGMSDKEEIRDIILPSIRNLFILLFIIVFLFSFYELPKSQFVFKASYGMGTELVNHALNRIYQIFSTINPALAGMTMFKVGCLVAFITLIIVGLCGFCALKGYSQLLKGRVFTLIGKKFKNIAYVCIFCTVLPIITGLYGSKYIINMDTIIEMFVPMSLTFLAAFCATGYAVLSGIASRLVFPNLLNKFKKGALLYILTIFLLQLFPPICLMVCGYGWLSKIGYDGIYIYIVWIIGHVLLMFPVLGSFVVATHFVVRNEELEWQKVHGVSAWEIISFSFLKRFKAEYILTFLFSYTMIWNDMIINSILSDYIPSFADKMQRLFIGRATDDTKAALFAILSITIAMGCVCVWNYVLKKNYANS